MVDLSDNVVSEVLLSAVLLSKLYSATLCGLVFC
jgi:hypothetical protein